MREMSSAKASAWNRVFMECFGKPAEFFDAEMIHGRAVVTTERFDIAYARRV